MSDSSARPFPLLQTKSIPQGTADFEKLRESIVNELYDAIPKHLWLPSSVIESAPLDVTDIPRSCGLLTDQELDITENYDATSLAAAIADKKFTSVAVATAFAKRAAIAHQLTCCLSAFFMDEAIERAKYLDDYLEKNGKTIGPLHGVPVSVKEHMAIANHYSSYGFVDTRVFNEADSLLISILRRAGAVFYVKTNQPQGIMHLESDSHYGRVNNPHNVNLSAGGSTGGEAALIAIKGSVLGLGTDIGGSVRGPCGFSGIHGFKPTTEILSVQGFLPGGFPAELNIAGTTGPMGRSLRDLDLYMSIVIGAKMYLDDPGVIPLPWHGLATPLAKEKKLKVGVMWTDGAITPQPPVQRMLKWAVEKLQEPQASTEFEVKTFMPYKAAEAIKLIRQMYWPDGGAGVKAHMQATGEPEFPLTTYVLADAIADKEKTATQVTDMRVQRDDFRAAFVHSWNKQDVDVVIAPVFVGPASKHDTAYYWNYTALWNFVDYPGIVVPTGLKVSKEEDGQAYPADYVPLSDECKHVKSMWEEGGWEGAPLALQIIGRRYHDSELMASLGKLQKVLGFA
ncbi:hypothetical protein DV737_g5205, partial [Chaetothyriales sp. CBS 132003]